MYELGLWTYVIALTHYTGELLVFRGCKLNGPFMSPLIVAGKLYFLRNYLLIFLLVSSLIWFTQVKDQYVKYY